MVLPGRDISWKEFFKTLKDEYERDQVSNVAGSVTFFCVLALFPFLIFLVALLSLVLDPTSVQKMVDQLRIVAPGQVADIIGTQLKSITSEKRVGLLTFGAAAAFISASGGIVAVIDALNTSYGVKETRPFWKVRALAFGVTLGAAAFSVVAALLAVGAPAVASWLGEPFATLVVWLRLPLAGLMMMSLWAALYYWLPDVEQQFRFITPGSVVGVLVWVLASYGFSFYVSHFGSYDATYGTLGGVMVLLMWMWVSSQVLLIGSEINALLEHKSPEGKGAGAHTVAEPAPNASKTEVEEAGGAVEAPPPAAPLMEGVPTATGEVQVHSKTPKALAWVVGAALVGLAFMLRKERA